MTRRSPARIRVGRRRAALLVAGACLAAPMLVACAEDTTVVVTRTVRTKAATAPVTTAPVTTAPVTAPTVTTPTVPTAELAQRLPAPDAVPGLQTATPTGLATARDLVRALYLENDPTAEPAVARLQAGGYQGGVIRDQRPSGATGPLLMRSYVFRMRDATAAQTEAAASVAETKAATTLPITNVELPDSLGTGLRIKAQNDTTILFVSFAAGRDVYGIQVFSQQGGEVFQDEVLQTVSSLYNRWDESP